MDFSSMADRLEAEITRLERGQEPSQPVQAEEWDQLNRLEEQARSPGYELSLDDMARAATIGPIFQQQISDLSSEALDQRITKAQQDRDTVSLFLFTQHAPYNMQRIAAGTLAPDTATLEQIQKVRKLQQRVKELESLPQHIREASAREQGLQVRAGSYQQGADTDVDRHMESLRASGMYAL